MCCVFCFLSSRGRAPYAMVGWRKVEEGGQTWFVNGEGRRFDTLAAAFDEEAGNKKMKEPQAQPQQLAFARDLLSRFGDETTTLDPEGGGKGPDGDDIEGAGKTDRRTATTNTLSDYLWRGDHPIVKDMPWYVYAMWVYKVAKPDPRRKQDG